MRTWPERVRRTCHVQPANPNAIPTNLLREASESSPPQLQALMPTGGHVGSRVQFVVENRPLLRAGRYIGSGALPDR